MEREQHISLRILGKVNEQSDFVGQKSFASFCVWEAQITPTQYLQCLRSASYKVGTHTNANVHLGTSCSIQRAATGNAL